MSAASTTSSSTSTKRSRDSFEAKDDREPQKKKAHVPYEQTQHNLPYFRILKNVVREEKHIYAAMDVIFDKDASGTIKIYQQEFNDLYFKHIAPLIYEGKVNDSFSQQGKTYLNRIIATFPPTQQILSLPSSAQQLAYYNYINPLMQSMTNLIGLVSALYPDPRSRKGIVYFKKPIDL